MYPSNVDESKKNLEIKVCTVGRESLYEFCVELAVAVSSSLRLTFPSGIFSLDFSKVCLCERKFRIQRITSQHFTFNFRNPCGLHSVTLYAENWDDNLFPTRSAVLLVCV